MISVPFFNWFTKDLIIGGDWRFFWPENLQEMSSCTLAWDSSLNTGIGRSNIFYLWINSYLGFFGNFYTNILHLPWNVAEKLIFFWPILFLSFFTAIILSRRVIKSLPLNILSGIIYLTNTYSLMIFGGGQVGIALGYAIAPLVLFVFMKLVDAIKIHSFPLRETIVAGLVLALQVMWDIRISFISLIMVFPYTLLVIFIHKGVIIKRILLFFLITGLVVLGIHSFWMLPLIIVRDGGIENLEEVYINVSAVDFFSFAKFENAISLLHPNWPENIFGKVGFQRSEFMLLPILAFSSLLFSKKPKILFFALLGLAGSFLAKGANEPFGFIYKLMFRYIPGFIMFRDPTKFYFLVTLSYSMLIPFALRGLSEKMKYKWAPVLLFVIFWIWTIKPMWLGELSGTFKSGIVPQQYNELRTFIAKQPDFFRTFWVPQRQRFGFFSNTHPAIDSVSLSNATNATGVVSWLSGDDAKDILSQWSIKYVILPYDSEGEIFMEDRRYSPEKRKNIEQGLDRISWLKKINVMNYIAIYEVPQYFEHFNVQQSNDSTMSIDYRMVDPTMYLVQIKNARTPFNLIFSEGYDSNWEAIVDNKTIKSTPYNRHGQNSFDIERTGDFEVVVRYSGQKYVKLGLLISFATLIISVVLIGYLAMVKKND